MKMVIENDLYESMVVLVLFLCGRVLWVTVRLSSGVSTEMVDVIFRVLVSLLVFGLVLLLCIGVCCVIVEFLLIVKKEVMILYIGEIYKGLGNLFVDVGEEILYFILEVMFVFIKVDFDVVVVWLSVFVLVVVKIWVEYV